MNVALSTPVSDLKERVYMLPIPDNPTRDTIRLYRSRTYRDECRHSVDEEVSVG